MLTYIHSEQNKTEFSKDDETQDERPPDADIEMATGACKLRPRPWIEYIHVANSEFINDIKELTLSQAPKSTYADK